MGLPEVTATEIAGALDALRVVPRLLMIFYMLSCWRIMGWFFELADPTAAQAAFASTIWGAGAAWFGLYVQSGRRGE